MAYDPFDEFFKRITKKLFKDFEIFEKPSRKEIAPEFIIRKPGMVEKGSGFSISISSDGINPPKIEMRRFGPSGRWEKVPLEEEKITKKVLKKKHVKIPALEKMPPPEVKEKVMPEYNVSVDVKEVTITLNAEGVESEDNVRVKFYPESVEIYAVSPKLNRGYFCTVAVPASIDKEGTAIRVEKERVVVRIPRQLSAV